MGMVNNLKDLSIRFTEMFKKFAALLEMKFYIMKSKIPL
jgi:hypothetical protein